MEAAPSRGAMPPPRAPAYDRPPPSADCAPSANSAPSAPSAAMPPPPARAKGKAKTGGGSAEGESPEGIGKGESGEGDTLKVMRSVGANEGEYSRGSTAEEGSTGGSSGKAHEIRDAGEPGVGGVLGGKSKSVDHSHLAKRLEPTSTVDKSLETGEEGSAAAAGTASVEAEAGDGKAGKLASESGNSGGGDSGGGESKPASESGSGGSSRGSRGSGSGGKAPYSIPDWAAVPKVPFRLEVVKDGTVAEEMAVSAKSAYMFGRIDRCDFMLQHPSISRYHAVIQYGEDSAAFLMDLHSTHKTFLNKQQVKPGTFVPLRVGDVIRFGISSRLYLFQGPQDLMPE
ncbi:unnamed protein product, partial [Closterium sp. NIES-54]